MKRPAALITGASKGIGRQIAITLAEEGYDIAVNYHTDRDAAEYVCQEVRKRGTDACAIYADMAKVEEIRAMYRQADEIFSGIDLAVNNAGISSEVYFLEAEESDFDKMTAIDWKGLFFSSQEAAKAMIRRKKKGVIVNISSNQVDGCWPRATIYGPTKAAVAKFTKNAAMELAGYGIRMVAVAPGYTDVGWAPEDIRWKAAERLPFRRFASTREIAEAVAYLASDKAAYITGTTLTVDGGATLPVVAANDFV